MEDCYAAYGGGGLLQGEASCFWKYRMEKHFQTKLVQQEARLLEKMTRVCTPVDSESGQGHSDSAPAEDESEPTE